MGAPSGALICWLHLSVRPDCSWAHDAGATSYEFGDRRWRNCNSENTDICGNGSGLLLLGFAVAEGSLSSLLLPLMSLTFI